MQKQEVYGHYLMRNNNEIKYNNKTIGYSVEFYNSRSIYILTIL